MIEVSARKGFEASTAGRKASTIFDRDEATTKNTLSPSRLNTRGFIVFASIKPPELLVQVLVQVQAKVIYPQFSLEKSYY
jgi:hypothetical protein